MSLTITLKQALLGFKKEARAVASNAWRSRPRAALKAYQSTHRAQIRHLDGHAVTIANEGVSSPGQVLRIQGEGMPLHGVPSEFGNLNCELKIEMPKTLTAEERKFVTDHFN